ncbi:L-aspartate oxidase [soil metagenome]
MQVIVVGTGIAGLVAALQARRNGHLVTLVTKSELAESNTKYAQGGIAAVMFPDDSVEAHIEDTLRVGAGLNTRRAVEVLCAEGPERIRDLVRLGVEFDRQNGGLARGREAAHSSARVLHAGGDATGAAIEAALVAAVRESAVRILEYRFVQDLVVAEGRVVGVEVLDPAGRPERIEADAVVLASGGAGQLYLHSTNPAVTTGDGVAAAFRAGARLSDLEFYQFHPTALALPGSFLISEAVRGEGAVLLDADGRRFMFDLHPDGEPAPRDGVARGIARQMAAQGGAHVLLDATALGRSFLAERFPGITATCAANGLDWGSQPIPVTPAAHYWMGGVRTDEWGRSSLPGLYAVGEVACTGVHGANRLASNSLLESLVFAWRSVGTLGRPWAELPAEASAGVIDPGRFSSAVTVPFDRKELQTLMWQKAGLFRSGDELTEAADQLAGWSSDDESVHGRENGNLLDLARLVVGAALAREESRGAHYRSDFPETVPGFARHLEYALPAPAAAKAVASVDA